MKDSPGGASAGKPSNLLGVPQCEGAPAAAVIRPEVELSNLMMCSRLSPSQASLQSGSSLGSVRGDEGGLYSDFYGDYCPLFDNGQDPESASLRGEENIYIILYHIIFMLLTHLFNSHCNHFILLCVISTNLLEPIRTNDTTQN